MNELNSATIGDFAVCKKLEKVAAALGLLNNSAPTELMMKVLEGPRADLILIPCKAARREWAAVEAILSHRSKSRVDDVTLKLASRDYGKFSTETAERTLRFWQLRNKIEK